MAEKLVIARFRDLVLVQGSADAFVEVSEPTGINPGDGTGWLISRIEFFFSQSSGLAGVSADFNIHWTVARDTKTSIAALTDNDVIYADGIHGSLTTSGQILIPALYSYEPAPGTVIVEPTLYATLDSTATGLTMTVVARVYYEPIRVSEVDALRMLTQG